MSRRGRGYRGQGHPRNQGHPIQQDYPDYEQSYCFVQGQPDFFIQEQWQYDSLPHDIQIQSRGQGQGQSRSQGQSRGSRSRGRSAHTASHRGGQQRRPASSQGNVDPGPTRGHAEGQRTHHRGQQRGHSSRGRGQPVECVRPKTSQGPQGKAQSESTSQGRGKKKGKEKEKKTTGQYLDHAFLVDPLTISFVKECKIIFLMRGPSGSGKTIIVSRMKERYNRAVVCCADNLFEMNGVYRFDKRKLEEAHRLCREEAEKHCSNGRRVVIIDNTNIERWEMQPYLDMAQHHGYLVVMVTARTPWQQDPSQLAAKSVHGLGEEFLRKKIMSFEFERPLYWGWFLNETGSKEIMELAEKYFDQCVKKLPAMRTALSVRDVHQATIPSCYQSSDEALHCTTFFCGGDDGKPGATEYRRKVQRYVGKCYKLAIIGFVITPKSIAARVSLNKKQLNLWQEDGHVANQRPSSSRGRSARGHTNVTNMDRGFANMSLSGATASGLHDLDSEESSSDDDLELSTPQRSKFTPTFGIGSRAHLTLGTGPRSTPKQAGNDLEEVIACESQGQCMQTEKVEGATIRLYDQARCVVYLNQQVMVPAVFTAKHDAKLYSKKQKQSFYDDV